MSLSKAAKRQLVTGLRSQSLSEEVSAAIDSQGSGPAASVALLGATVNLVGVDGVGDNAAPVVETEARLDAIEAKVDAVITALKNASLML